MTVMVYKIAERKWESIWSDDKRSVYVLIEYGERENYYGIINNDCIEKVLQEFTKDEFSLGDDRSKLITGYYKSEFIKLGIELSSKPVK